METLIIRHIDDSNPPQFQVARQKDGKSAEPAHASSPYTHPVEGRPRSNLMAELRWYLERFLDYPFPPETDRAEKVQDAFRRWGAEVFTSLFSGRSAARFYDEATRKGHSHLCLQISSDDPAVLAWPWEALHDPETGFLAHTCRIERRLNRVRDPMDVSGDLPRDRINILLVTARPYENDVQYRSLSRPLVELIEKQRLPASIHVLRPPTFDRLREHLREKPCYYHILHFDGHGAYGRKAACGPDGYSLRGALGRLIFEAEDGSPCAVTAEQLSLLLREHAVPCVVLNACQSAMVDASAEGPFASVAASLLQAGFRSVVAMAYALYVSGGKQFLPAFYRRLFETGSPMEATRAGRQQMLASKSRTCSRGRFPLDDWLVPVLYQQDALDFSFASPALLQTSPKEPRLPSEARDEENPYGFIGRDSALLKLERAVRKPAPAVLIHGLGGVGKTTLARGFLEWLDATQGLGNGAFWFSFQYQDIRSAEYVFNRMGEALLDPDFSTFKPDTKISRLAALLKEQPFTIVWDNFESVQGIPGTEVRPLLPEKDQALLLAFLKRLRGGKSKVIVTSRSEEEWLGVERLKISLGGLEDEERWEYCDAILDALGIKINQNDKTLVELMDYLRGHPLAMRVILPKLEKLSASQVLNTLKTNLEHIVPGRDETQDRLFATLRFAVELLPDGLRPLLIPLALHEHYVDGNLLEFIAKSVNRKWSRGHIDRFLHTFASAGLLHDMGKGIFEMHPALTGFLRSAHLKSVASDVCDAWSSAFVNIIGCSADNITPRPLHEQHHWFTLHKANFYHALQQAKQLDKMVDYSAIVQVLAAYAQNTRNWREAENLFGKLSKTAKGLNRPDVEAAAYHQLGIIAQEQRDFETARNRYLKSLEIKERLGDEQGTASTYHQLGIVAQKLGNLEDAWNWYLKSLKISERYGNEHGVALTYHQLGIITEEQRDFEGARKWYLKSLKIKERCGIRHEIASTYHQLGRIAEKQQNFMDARKCYQNSLEISKKLGIEHGVALNNHQLGIIAQKLGDFEDARRCYLKSLEIEERLGNQHGIAGACAQMGILERFQEDYVKSGQWFIRAVVSLLSANDRHYAQQAATDFFRTYSQASPEERVKLKTMWEKANLGPFPKDEQP